MGKMGNAPATFCFIIMEVKAKYDAGVCVSLRGEKIFSSQKRSKSGPKMRKNDKSEHDLTKKLQKVADFVQFCTRFFGSIY